MKFERVEDIPVWQDGSALREAVLQITGDKNLKFKKSAVERLNRQASFVPEYISEGFERGTNRELIGYLYYARGSAGEVLSILCDMELQREFSALKPRISELKTLADSITLKLKAWIASLQSAEIDTSSFEGGETMQSREREKRRKEYEEELMKRLGKKE